LGVEVTIAPPKNLLLPYLQSPLRRTMEEARIVTPIKRNKETNTKLKNYYYSI
jgi:hypothetical protein